MQGHEERVKLKRVTRTIHVVTGSTSDGIIEEKWHVRAFADFNEAVVLCNRLNAFCHEFGVEWGEEDGHAAAAWEREGRPTPYDDQHFTCRSDGVGYDIEKLQFTEESCS